MRQYLTFRLANLYYGIDIKSINSVLEPQPMTPIDCEGEVIQGLTNVRGLVVPIVDVRAPLASTKLALGEAGEKADVPEQLRTDEAGIIVLEMQNGTLLNFIGIKVDGIGKVFKLEDDALAAVPPFLGEEASRYYEGFTVLSGFRIALLNLGELLSADTLFRKGASHD